MSDATAVKKALEKQDTSKPEVIKIRPHLGTGVKVEVRNIFSKVPNPQAPEGRQKAKQEFKDDADLNSIIRKFGKQALIDHNALHQANYDFATPFDLKTALDNITTANSMFMDLPSRIRDEFRNEPQAFLEFVQSESNYERAQELGLRLSPAAEQAALARLERAAGEAGANAPSGSEGTDPPGGEAP